MATHKPQPSVEKKPRSLAYNDDESDIDEATFLFEDDEDEEDFEPKDEEEPDFKDDWE
jgi:hypothetical protein